MKSRLTIALLGRYFGWGGGIDLLRNIANALSVKAKSEPINLFLLLPVENRIESRSDIVKIGKGIIRDLVKFKFRNFKERPLYDASMLDFFGHIDGNIEIVFHNDTKAGLCQCLRKIDADVVLPVHDCLDSSFPLPWLGYLYDFQHKYHPEFFDIDTCRHRDIFFGSILNMARGVLVNARSVEKDISNFYPGNHCRIFSMPFAPTPVTAWFEEPEEEKLRTFSLPDRYFIISNQFWIHKSHGTAFEAIAILLHKMGLHVHLVCTGKTEDHRFPDYFIELQAKIAAWGVGDRIHFLGHIPKRDQIQILKKSIAVIQPTLFEGGPGGGSVYDAVALGVPVIMSDIPVNREITDETVRFFLAGSAEDLANKMAELISDRLVRPSLNELIVRGRERAEQLGDTLLTSIEYVMQEPSEVR